MPPHDRPDAGSPAQLAPPDGVPAAAAPSRPPVISCEAAMRWLWDYVDARLPAAPHAALEAHLAACAACPAHVAFARAVRHALADAPAPGWDGVADPARLRARVQRALADARSASASEPGPEPGRSGE